MKKTILILLVIALVLSSCDITFRGNVQTLKATSNQTTAEVSINRELIESSGVDSIIIRTDMVDSLGLPVRSESKTYETSAFVGRDTIPYDYGNYGKHEVTVLYNKNGKNIAKDVFDFVLTADEYNIALLSATMPVTFLSMLMTKESAGIDFNNTLPTIIAIERAKSYNWDALYPNMYPCPFSTEEEIRNSGTSKGQKNYLYDFATEMRSYVSYLKKLNPESKFHLVLNDTTPHFLLQIFFENGIDLTENSVLFLSDGSATYSIIRSEYGAAESAEDPSLAKYEKYKDAWEAAKEKALKGDTSYLSDIINLTGYSFWPMRAFMPVIASEETNVQWVFNRKDANIFGATDVYNQKISSNPNAKTFNLGSHSASFTQEQKESLINLFKLDLDVFNEAEQEGKKIMIFLGSRPDSEVNLRDYFTFMTNYCGTEYNPGTEYQFFYKGHPGYITEYYEDKTALFNEFNVINLDSSIPAELFLLFNGDVEMCGIQSSTFSSYTHDEIPFLVSDPSTADYASKINTVLLKNNTSDPAQAYTVKRKADSKYCYWNPENPTVFNWITE